MPPTEAVARGRALDGAEKLFYDRGVRAVGMDSVRDASGVSLKRLYGLFGSKEQLLVEALTVRDERWMASLQAAVDERAGVVARIGAVFEWLHEWFGEPGFRGCAFVNVFAELGSVSPAVAACAREHKQRFRDLLHRETAAAGLDAKTADSIHLLAEGAIVNAALLGDREGARTAGATAARLLGMKSDATSVRY